VDLRTILANAVDAIAPDCAERRHHLVVNLPAEALWVHADGARLEQVFSNLLINAAKCTPNVGEITVTLEFLGKHASVRIRDSGIGIAAAQLTRIFEMFVQVDETARHNEGGRGIGLAVVRDLVEMHGGTVEAMSAGLNLGSEFTVLLPALLGRPDEESATSSAMHTSI
jgi:signal transduction histidine kinase